MMRARALLLSVFMMGAAMTADAQGGDSTRVYTSEDPLVYEDAWDLWPYTFLNENGEPDGFNVDLIRMLMGELKIPYVIKLKPANEAFNDLKNGNSDLMLGLAAGFHDEFGKYSTNSVTLFTQSVVTPKSKPLEIKSFRDLGKHKVIVNDSSLCHHLMLDYNWGANAIPVEDIREAIQEVSDKEEGQIVWNTLSLKWLLQRYHIDNLELTPVNMPHGQYKFMSNDQHLLNMLDDEFARLYSMERITPIQNKWFYPEREANANSALIWYLAIVAGVLLLILGAYAISYRVQAKRLTSDIRKRNKRLALILQTSHVRLWTYDIKNNRFAWRNDNGQVAYTYSMEEFAQRYSPEDFVTLKATLDRLSQSAPDDKDVEQTLTLRAKDVEGGDTEDRDYYIALSVLSRDKKGKPTVIIGLKKDITEERKQQRLANERTMRYWAIFNTSMAGIILFGKDGRLQNINDKACEMYSCKAEEIIAENVTLADVFDTGDTPIEQLNDVHATQYVNLDRIPDEQRHVKSIKRKGMLCNEYRLMTVYDDNNELIGVFAVCLEVTDAIEETEQMNSEKKKLEEARAQLMELDTNIDGVLHESDVRLATYSPQSHTLTIHRSVGEVQHMLTQTRCMTLVDDRSKKLAMRVLNLMDQREKQDIKADIRTTLRVKGGKPLCLQFCLMPTLDKQGEVVEYLGLCRDFSELQEARRQTALHTEKVQEVENTKNSFVKNMVQEIHVPMDAVQSYVQKLDDKRPTQNEPEQIKGILENADYLLHLIDNVLYLSRLEARMVEINKQKHDFAQTFESQCRTGWLKYQNHNTRYLVETPYEQLVVDIDQENLGHVIEQVTANAAQHTKSGTVRARFDYIGRRLNIIVEDTGEGIPVEQLRLINSSTAASSGLPGMKGLGLAICRELLVQMGGAIEVSSEVGVGTTVYITLPCHATTIKRKKLA